MSAAGHNRLATARQDLVHQTIAESVRTLGGHLPPPAVVFIPDGKSEGEFDPEHNRVKIRSAGFLGDPSVSVARIRAAVAHEMGHWADPTTSAQARRMDAIWLAFYASAAAVVIAAVVTLIVAGRESPWPVAAIPTAIALWVVAMVLTARTRWPGEYFADAAAARVVGVAAVIELVETFPPGRFSHTHPRPEDRIRRVLELTSAPRDGDS